MKNEPSNNIKNSVDDELKTASNATRLKCKNIKALVDYCSCAPEMWSRDATVTSVRSFFS